MGQQQLLLLVLSIVIVGLSVVNGIQAFTENDRKARIDRYFTNVNRIAADALAWKAKPRALGGGTGANYMTGLSFEDLGFSGITEFSCGTARCQEVEYIDGYLLMWGLDSENTHFVQRNEDNTLQVAVYFYGNAPSCIRYRIGWRDDTSTPFTFVYTPDSNVSSPPATCDKPWPEFSTP
ncbi:MAG: hypothetical protein AAFN13_08195 [Bacteroidota bacterium]